jgi:rod shape determining protein RodA
MPSARGWRQFDLVLLGVLLTLVALGVAMIRSANLDSLDQADLWRRQETFALIGLGLFFLMAALPYEWLKHFWWVGYVIALALLVLVLIYGESEIGDVRRWFYIGEFRFQPSFPSLLLHVVAVAAVLDRRSRKDRRVEGSEEAERRRPGVGVYILTGLMTMVLAGLVFREPDLSTAVVCVVAWAAMVFVSEVRLGYLVSTTAVAIGALFPLWRVMQPYQRERVLAFLSLTRDSEAPYNVQQALISIGSGGLWGSGYGEGSLNRLHYLRVRHTDYIFSVIGEELGFIGALLVLVLFVLMAWRLFRAALLAPDRFGRLLVVGVGTLIFFQAVINVGMNLGMLPVTGLPLPFVSYGGTALVTFMVGLGLVEAVAVRRK